MLEMVRIKVKLNKSNFRKRIVSLWQDQKENEVYDFEFEDEETEKEFDKLLACFEVESSTKDE